jgi:peptide deformylase
MMVEFRAPSGLRMTAPLVVAYPDPRLAQAAEPVRLFDRTLRAEAERLLVALRTVPAIGLAGPHLGIMRRIIAVDLEAAGHGGAAEVFVDPVVVAASDETASFEEGSVSLPGIRETVVRPARIDLVWKTVEGEARLGSFAGFAAACIQHEVDQCDGIFWLARLSRLKRERALARFRKTMKNA